MERYEMHLDDNGKLAMERDCAGDYVLHADAQAEINRLRLALYAIAKAANGDSQLGCHIACMAMEALLPNAK